MGQRLLGRQLLGELVQVVLLVEPLLLDFLHVDLFHFLADSFCELDPDIWRVAPFLYLHRVLNCVSGWIKLLQNDPVVDLRSCLLNDRIFDCASAWL